MKIFVFIVLHLLDIKGKDHDKLKEYRSTIFDILATDF